MWCLLLERSGTEEMQRQQLRELEKILKGEREAPCSQPTRTDPSVHPAAPTAMMMNLWWPSLSPFLPRLLLSIVSAVLI